MTTNHIPAASAHPPPARTPSKSSVRSKLVERKGRQLHATTEGERLTDVVEPRLKDVLLTARMEQALSDVEHGKRGPADVMDMFHREALRIPADATANLKADAVTRTANTDAQEWGDCRAAASR